MPSPDSKARVRAELVDLIELQVNALVCVVLPWAGNRMLDRSTDFVPYACPDANVTQIVAAQDDH